MAPTSARLAAWRFSFPPGSRSRKPRPSSATAYPACSTTSPPIHHPSEAVLGPVAESLGGWRWPLMLVTPRTVVGWHRAGFRLYWKWLSRARPRGGRKPVSQEIRALIFQIAAENPTWGAPRIHGELLMLGFEISEPTVSRWLWSYQILGTANPYPRHIWGIRWRQSFYWFRGRSRRLPQVSYGPGKSVTDR